MSLKEDHIADKKPPNPITGDWKRKPDKDQLIKKPSNLNGELRKKIDNCWRKNIDKKIVNEKSLDPEGVLGGKPTFYDWGSLKKRES